MRFDRGRASGAEVCNWGVEAPLHRRNRCAFDFLLALNPAGTFSAFRQRPWLHRREMLLCLLALMIHMQANFGISVVFRERFVSLGIPV